jgi:hypothetical protein
MINELIKLATHLDNKGYHREANYLDGLLKVSRDRKCCEDLASRIQELEETVAGLQELAFAEAEASLANPKPFPPDPERYPVR